MLIPRGWHSGGVQLLTGLTSAQVLGALHYMAITRPDTQASLVVLYGAHAAGVLLLRRGVVGVHMYWNLAGGHTLLT